MTTDNQGNSLSEESVAVQAHLQILQSVIQRMAGNSTSCKSWCITIVSAILVLIADKGKPELAWLALLPSVLFLALDAYYLALERAFRVSYNEFIKKLHGAQAFVDDLFTVIPKGEMSHHQVDALKSFSIWGFYGALVVLVLLAKEVVL
ncbi:MAG: hypothetical protein LBT71_07020 [Azoarcus sp.]|jgi:hypothetical protein|nr:hypothetical protein [Azoarcus sp.]